MKISVITATYNNKEFLPEMIRSVKASIFKPLTDVEIEHIIYDDASTDGTEELFKQEEFKNIIYIRDSENHGPAYSRNRAIEKATGKFIFILDSDDVILQRTLYNFLSEMLNSNVDLLIADFLHVDKNLSYILGEDYYGWPFKNNIEILTSIFEGNHFIQQNTFFRKDLFIELGRYDESIRMGEDLDLYIRFFLHNSQIKYCNFMSHLHRFHSTNLSSNIDKSAHKKIISELYQKYKSDLSRLEIVDPFLTLKNESKKE